MKVAGIMRNFFTIACGTIFYTDLFLIFLLFLNKKSPKTNLNNQIGFKFWNLLFVNCLFLFIRVWLVHTK